MRRIKADCFVIAVLAATLPALALAAATPDRRCKAIRQAVGAGMTMEQIVGESGMDEVHVMKCLQSKGKKRKPKRPSKPSNHTGSVHHESAKSTGGGSRTAVGNRQPNVP